MDDRKAVSEQWDDQLQAWIRVPLQAHTSDAEVDLDRLQEDDETTAVQLKKLS